MDKLLLTLDTARAPGAWFAALLEQVPGTWRIEAAAHAWRAERVDGRAVAAVGLSRPAVDGPWVLTWRVDGDVPDHVGLLALGTAVGLGTVVLFATAWLEWQLVWRVVASAATVMVTLETSKHWIGRRLVPDVDAAQAALGRDLRAAVASAPSAEVVSPAG